ncbi:hypothetical protein [Citrobacter sp. Marseille-Q6884]|uniref:hypothetical protein n=1 Tax=Citrobacter sp. Marseille-Q6884 TaxID=2956786 RepID=UPI0021B4AB2B|nr:hypothetical protein [Citrobacter sp. Marseille-Q6884]
MNYLPISNLNCWQKITSGTGSVTIQNGGRSAKFDGVAGSGAQIQKNLVLSPNGVYKVSFFARATRGNGNVWVADGASVVVNSQRVLTDQWERYEVTGSSRVFSDSLSSYVRISIGIATAEDGAIEVSDVCVAEDVSSFGSLKCIAAGIIIVNNGAYSISQNFSNINSVQAENTNVLSVTCLLLNSSAATPMISISHLDGAAGSQTVGRIQPMYYDKASGKALFRFMDNNNTTVPIASVNCGFSFKAETI